MKILNVSINNSFLQTQGPSSLFAFLSAWVGDKKIINFFQKNEKLLSFRYIIPNIFILRNGIKIEVLNKTQWNQNPPISLVLRTSECPSKDNELSFFFWNTKFIGWKANCIKTQKWARPIIVTQFKVPTNVSSALFSKWRKNH